MLFIKFNIDIIYYYDLYSPVVVLDMLGKKNMIQIPKKLKKSGFDNNVVTTNHFGISEKARKENLFCIV